MNITCKTRKKLYTSVICELKCLEEYVEIEVPYIVLDQEPSEIFTLEFRVLPQKQYDVDKSKYFTLILTFENYAHKVTNDYGYEIFCKIETIDNEFIPLFLRESMRTANSISITDKLTILDSISTKCRSIYFDIQRFNRNKGIESNDLCENLSHLLTSESDIAIVVGDKKFYAHKDILSSKSDVFKRMCTSEMTENLSSTITIEEFAPEVIEEMLQYIYTGKCRNFDKISRQLFKAAHKYDLVGLQNICKEYFIFDMNIENVVPLLDTANLYELEDLAKGALKVIANNEEKMTKIKAFQKFLCRNLNTNTIVYTIDLSFKYNIEFVKTYIMKYIKQHQKELAESGEFMKLFESHPKLMQEIFINISK